jgi:hypothetical protein
VTSRKRHWRRCFTSLHVGSCFYRNSVNVKDKAQQSRDKGHLVRARILGMRKKEYELKCRWNWKPKQDTSITSTPNRSFFQFQLLSCNNHSSTWFPWKAFTDFWVTGYGSYPSNCVKDKFRKLFLSLDIIDGKGIVSKMRIPLSVPLKCKLSLTLLETLRISLNVCNSTVSVLLGWRTNEKCEENH